ncbi:hypothetical protein HY496_00725 [Candidatus Woesearchaeota archaeon]|nr:hypothetical protein [Candidatus Woesearchaeota archaeon]
MGMEIYDKSDYRNDAWESIPARIENRYRKVGKLFKRSIHEMNALLAEFDIILNEFKYLTRSLKVGIKNAKYEQIKERMKKWPEELETYTEIILSTLGEEWENAEEVFTDAFVNSIRDCVSSLNDVLKGERYKDRSTTSLREAIDEFVKKETPANAEKIETVLKKIKSSLDNAAYDIHAEKFLMITDHLMAQQMLGDKFLRDHAGLLVRELQKRLNVYYQALEEQRIGGGDPGKAALSIMSKRRGIEVIAGTRSWRTDSIHFRHPLGDIKRQIVTIIIRFLDNKDSLGYDISLYYETERDRFRCIVRRFFKETFLGDVLKEYVFTELSDFLDDAPQEIFSDFSLILGKSPH